MAIGETQIDDGVFRVTRWTIEPEDEIARHVHEFDNVVVPLVDGTMHVRTADGSETAVEMRIGRSYARQSGVEHTVTNRGRTVIEFVEIEKRH